MGSERPAGTKLEHDIVTAAYRLFTRDGYDGTTAEAIAAECGVSVETVHRYFESKDATLAIIGFRSVERALENLPSELSMAELVRRLADAFDECFARDGGEIVWQLMKDHPLVQDDLPVWRHEWAKHLAQGLAADSGRKRPSVTDRVFSSMAMEVIGIGLDEWMHRSGDATLPDVVSEIAAQLDRALGDLRADVAVTRKTCGPARRLEWS